MIHAFSSPIRIITLYLCLTHSSFRFSIIESSSIITTTATSSSRSNDNSKGNESDESSESNPSRSIESIVTNNNSSIENNDEEYNQLLHDLDDVVSNANLNHTNNSTSSSSSSSSNNTSTTGQEDLLSNIASSYITKAFQSRLSKSFSTNIQSTECRAKVSHHLRRYIDAIAKEEPFPYTTTKYPYDCPIPHYNYDQLPEGITLQTLMETSYQPPVEEATYIQNEQELVLLYGILMHDGGSTTAAKNTIRLIEALHTGHNTIFVIHVDGKEESDVAYYELVEYSRMVENVYVLPDEYRIRVNWGGFTMVNAT